MAARVGWSQRALRDVEAIAEYIAEDSPVYAAVVVRNIIAQTKMLSHFQGAVAKSPSLMMTVFGSYLLIATGSSIASRKIKRLFPRFLCIEITRDGSGRVGLRVCTRGSSKRVN